MKNNIILKKQKAIFQKILCESDYINAPNFDKIHDIDLGLLFEFYDDLFFNNNLKEMLKDKGINFQLRLSKRMTRSGGKTIIYRNGRMEIAVSIYLLFLTFNNDIKRPILINGIECKNRLQALQRIFEHEIIHLYEYLTYGTTNCRSARFLKIAGKIFGHTQASHQLVSQNEKAYVTSGIQVGDKVSFDIDGEHYKGLITRITKRATVMVENNNGSFIVNGKRCIKCYVPLSFLKKD